MSDKTLLELAARAGDYLIERWNDGTEPYSSGEGFFIWTGKNPSSLHFWNPRTDDGDSLRLAADLHINLKFESYMVTAYRDERAIPFTYPVEEFATASHNIRSATRMAILRLAVEIGKQMEDKSP